MTCFSAHFLSPGQSREYVVFYNRNLTDDALA